MKCELFILNRDLQLLAAIDNSESVIVSKRYNAMDEIQITIVKGKENTDLLAYGNYIVVNNRLDTIFRVYKRTESLSSDGEVLEVLGYSIEKLLSQRITMPPTDSANLTVENTVSNVAYTYIDKACINNTLRNELNFSRVALGAPVDSDTVVKDSTRYKNLYEEVQRLCSLKDFGTRSYLDMAQGKIVLQVYNGVDKSFGNTQNNTPIVFSREYENVIETSLDFDYTVVQNDITIAGQGEGANRMIRVVNSFDVSPTQAEDIVCIFQDGRDITQENENELINRAKSELIEPQISIDGAINPFVAYDYLKDYQLGDIVTLYINGIKFNERIVECVETYESNNFSLQVIFGQKVYNITDVIKQQTKSIKQLEVI